MAGDPSEKYLIQLIKSALLQEAVPAPIAGTSFSRVMEAARRQQLGGLAADRLCLLPNIPQDKAAQLQAERLNAIRLDALQQSELRRVSLALTAAGIRHLPLKGTVIKACYPHSFYRSMSDLDILVDEASLPRLDALLAPLGYGRGKSGENHLCYRREELLIEFHERLLPPDAAFDPFRDDPWVRTHPSPKNPLCFQMEDEQFYLHMLLHMAQHFAKGGMGARFVADQYVFLRAKGAAMDRALIEAALGKAGLTTFEAQFIELTRVWFEQAEPNALSSELEDYVLGAGIYGSPVQREALERMKHDGAAYYLHALFEPPSLMRELYPVLGKAPVLLPALYVHRLIKRLFTRRKQVKNRLRSAARVETQQVDRVQALYEALDLDPKRL